MYKNSTEQQFYGLSPALYYIYANNVPKCLYSSRDFYGFEIVI